MVVEKEQKSESQFLYLFFCRFHAFSEKPDRFSKDLVRQEEASLFSIGESRTEVRAGREARANDASSSF